MRQFPAVVYRDHDDGTVYFFPDLPGCVVFAESPYHGPDVAADVLADHLAEMTAAGEPIPNPSAIEALKGDMLYANGLVILIPAVGTRIFYAAVRCELPS